MPANATNYVAMTTHIDRTPTLHWLVRARRGVGGGHLDTMWKNASIHWNFIFLND